MFGVGGFKRCILVDDCYYVVGKLLRISTNKFSLYRLFPVFVYWGGGRRSLCFFSSNIVLSVPESFAVTIGVSSVCAFTDTYLVSVCSNANFIATKVLIDIVTSSTQQSHGNLMHKGFFLMVSQVLFVPHR